MPKRSNRLELMLSDDELALVKLLAAREKLSAPDYLRALIRRAPTLGPKVDIARIRQIMELVGVDVDLTKPATTRRSASKTRPTSKAPAPEKRGAAKPRRSRG